MAAKKSAESVSAMIAQHAVNTPSVNDASLSTVANLAKQQFDAAQKINDLSEQLAEAQKTLKRISETDLPEAMRECGISTFTTTDGIVIDVKEEVAVGIPAPRKEEAFEWLTQHGFGGLIKSVIDVPFTREERKKAEKLAQQLRAKGYDVSLGSSVHYQTLKAFVKERMADTESEVEFPLDLFGAFPYTVATVKKKEAKAISRKKK